MMYFDSLVPKITQGSDTFYDMFFNLSLLAEIKEEYLITYHVEDGETVQDIAYKFYDKPQLWWLICLVNNFKDPVFDMPFSVDYIQRVSIANATIYPLFWKSDSTQFYGENTDFFWYKQENYIVEYEKLSVENEERRNIKVIHPNYIATTISQIIKKAQNG